MKSFNTSAICFWYRVYLGVDVIDSKFFMEKNQPKDYEIYEKMRLE